MPMRLTVGTHYAGQTSWWLNGHNHSVVACAGRTFDSVTDATQAANDFKHGPPPQNSNSTRGRVAAGVGVPGTPSSRWRCRPTASRLNKTPDAPLKMCGPTPPHPVVLVRARRNLGATKARTHLETSFEVIEAIQLPSEAGPLEIRQHFVAMFAPSRCRRTALFCAQIAVKGGGQCVTVGIAASRPPASTIWRCQLH